MAVFYMYINGAYGPDKLKANQVKSNLSNFMQPVYHLVKKLFQGSRRAGIKGKLPPDQSAVKWSTKSWRNQLMNNCFFISNNTPSCGCIALDDSYS